LRVLGVALEALLGNPGELAEMSLLEEGFTVCRKGEGGDGDKKGE
jgi:hypothetical protein